MVSGVEKLIRKMDNPSKSACATAKDIARELNLNEHTCRSYLNAKREGYASRREYMKDFLARKGFKSDADYQHYLDSQSYPERLSKEVRAILGEQYIPDKAKILNPRSIENLAREEKHPAVLIEKEDLMTLVNELTQSSRLTQEERTVIIGRFYDDKPLGTIAAILKVSKQEVLFTERDALEKLRYSLIAKGIRDLKDCA